MFGAGLNNHVIMVLLLIIKLCDSHLIQDAESGGRTLTKCMRPSLLRRKRLSKDAELLLWVYGSFKRLVLLVIIIIFIFLIPVVIH